MNKIIAIANQKGGVGKTTVSVNLSHNLAVSGKKVLLIDIDPQGNATSSLGVTKPSQGGVWKFLTNNQFEQEQISTIPSSGLGVLPASSKLRDLEASLKDAPSQTTRLKLAFENNLGQWDLILIDCPPSLGVLTANAFALAHEILIPVQPEFLAMEGLAQMVEAQKLIQREINIDLKIGGVVLNMVDPSLELSRDVEKEIRSFFGDLVYESTIRRDIVLAEAPSHSKAVLDWAPRSLGCMGMAAVTKELLSKYN